MTPLQMKIVTVLLTVTGMLVKQYATHGYIDPVELAQWLSGNWDILLGGLAIGAVTIPRKEEFVTKQG